MRSRTTSVPALLVMLIISLGIPLQLTFAMVFGFTAFVMLFFIGASTFLSRISGVRYRVWKRMHRFTFPILTIALFHSIRLGSDMYGVVRVLWIALWVLHPILMAAKLEAWSDRNRRHHRRYSRHDLDCRSQTKGELPSRTVCVRWLSI